MIPKIIHYIWFGGKELPPRLRECVDSWQRVMPDWQLRCWDESAVADIDLAFVHEALAEGKYAFASDVVRLWALYHEGGLYLDTDVMVFKPFDPLLDNHAFTGRESSMHINGRQTVNYVTTCCMGAEPGSEFIARCLSYYRGRHFVACEAAELPSELRLDMRLNSEVVCKLATQLGYEPSVLRNDEQRLGALTVYPREYFDPAGRQPQSYCQHLAEGTWREAPRYEPAYTLRYKLAWRLQALAERAARKFNFTLVKLR